MQLRTLNRVIYVLCLIAPWSLLWLDSGLLFPYTTGKAWVFRSIVEIAFALSLMLKLFQSQTASPIAHQDRTARLLWIVLITFFVWTALANAFGVDSFRSFWSNWERMGGFIDYLHWAMYLVCLLSVLNKTRSRFMLGNLVLIISLVCVIALLGSGEHRISTLGNRIFVGNLAVFGMFISGFLWVGSYHSSPRTSFALRGLLLTAIIIMIGALLNAASRGAMLSLSGAGAIVILGFAINYARQFGRTAVALLTVAVIVFAGLFATQIESLQDALRHSGHYGIQRLGEISLHDQTTTDRLENWSIALDAAQAHPWAGWGQENYMIAFNEFYRAGSIDNAKLWFDRAHNAYFDALIASGIPGFMLYCLMLGLPVWLVGRMAHWSGLKKFFAMGFFVSFALKSAVGFDTFSSTLIWLSMITMLQVHDLGPLSKNENKATRKTFGPGISVSLLVLLMLSFTGIYYLNFKPYQENLHYADLLRQANPLSSGSLGEILAQPTKDLRYAQNSKLAVFDSLLSTAYDRELTAIEAKRRDLVFQRAGALIEDALRQQPENYRIKYNGARLLARLGHYDLSIRMLEDLTRASPNRTAFWHTLAQTYAANGLPELALNAASIVNQLNPNWSPDNVRKTN